MKVRRVVTGHSPSGKSIFVSDSKVEAPAFGMLPGTFFHRLWKADAAPSFPDSGEEPGGHAFFPPKGGFRFMMMTIPPHETTEIVGDKRALMAEVKAGLPG